MPDWAEILNSDGPAAWRTAYRIVGNRADADECFQEACLAALNVSRRQVVRQWSALLRRLAAARAVDRLRQRRRRRDREQETDVAALAGGVSPTERVEERELAEQLRSALAKIPSQQAELFCLHCLEQWSYQEIADELGISTSRVGVLIYRACAQIVAIVGGRTTSENAAKGDIMTRPVQPSDELLSRAEAAFRGEPIPAGPSAEVMARTLSALNAAGEQSPWSLVRRRTMRLAISLAAAVLLALGGLVYVGSMTSVGPPVAWADVAAKLSEARTSTYRTTISGKDVQVPMTSRTWLKVPGQMRMESSNGFISIMEGDPETALYLDSATKTAYFAKSKNKSKAKITGKFQPGPQVTDLEQKKDHTFAFSGFEKFKNLAKEKGVPVGKKKIGDVEAQGFRVQQNGLTSTVWVDPQSRRPLVIEHTQRSGDKDMTMTMSDFVVDSPLDDALFSLKPPADYKVTEGQVEVATSEESFVQLLRLYAEATGGAFPPKLDDWSDYDKQLNTEQFKKPGSFTDPKYIQLVQTVMGGMMFVLQHKDQYVYRPENIKLGEADKMLLWYKPEGSEKYRAIYGDLHVSELAADQVPERPAK